MAYLSELEVNTVFYNGWTSYHDIAHVSGDIYVLAYEAAGAGRIASMRLSTEGVLTLLADRQYKAAAGTFHKVVVLANNVFAIFGSGAAGIGDIYTLSVNLTTGVLTDIDNDTFDTLCDELSVVHVAGTVYAICYQGPGSDGWLRTWDIADNGVIGAQIGQWEWDPANGECEDLYHIPGTLIYIAISFSNVFTFKIANTGVITPAIIDTFVLSNCEHPRMAHIAGTKYAFAYRNTATNRLVVNTLDIQNDGSIAAALTDTWTYWMPGGHDAYIFRMSYYPAVFFVLYTGIGYASEEWGEGLQLEIADDGTIGTYLNAYTTSQTIAFGATTDDPGRKSVTPISGSNLIAVVSLSAVHGVIAGRITTFGFQPIVTTQPVPPLGPVTGHGTITDLGEPVLTQHGFVWSNAPNPTYYPGSAWQVELGPGGLGAFSAVIPTTGLIVGDTYHIRAFAFNACEIGGVVYGSNVAYGADETFIAHWLPAVTSDPATMVSLLAATPNGTLTDDGGEVCACGFEWGPTIAYGNTTPTQDRVTGQTFSQYIFALLGNTTYHFRAFATNSAGTSYGADRTLTTLMPEAGRAYALSRSEL